MARLELILEAPQAAQIAERLAGINIPELLRSGLRDWARRGQQTVERATPIRTGLLARSWSSTAGAAEAEIANETPYARFVLEGTRPHRITGHPFLAFMAGGKTVVTHSVEHPGTRGDAELEHAIEQVIDQALDVGRSITDAVAGKVGH